VDVTIFEGVTRDTTPTARFAEMKIRIVFGESARPQGPVPADLLVEADGLIVDGEWLDVFLGDVSNAYFRVREPSVKHIEFVHDAAGHNEGEVQPEVDHERQDDQPEGSSESQTEEHDTADHHEGY
jgi:hypothetical protein